MKKTIALVMAAAMTLSMFSACGNSNSGNNQTANNQSNSDSGTVKIGAMGPYTGDLSVYGTSVLNGIKQAVAEINADGGIGGKQIELASMDDKGDPNECVNAYNKMRSEDVDAIIGAVTSGPSIAISDIAGDEYEEGNAALVLTPSGTALDITTYGENIFRACFTDPFQGKTMADFAAENLGAKKVAVIYDNSSDYSQGITEAFVAEAQAKDMEVVAQESYGSDNVDFSTQLTNIQGKNPDVLFIPDYYEKVALITTQARKIGLDIPFLGTDGWDGVLDVLDANSVSVVNGCYFSSHYSTTDTAENVQTFVSNYEKQYNVAPTAFSALAYDCVYMLKQVIEENGTDAEAMVAGMQAISYDGVTGRITFDENGDPVKSVSILTLNDGVVSLETKMDVE